MEILAPAGSEEALISAVQSGADAVYMGGRKFSARHSAKNFSSDDMKRCIDYCHVRGVDVHVAANILVKEKETEEFIEYIGELNEIGADAVIIQDIGMAAKVKKFFPELSLHASTQMTAASLDAVKYLEKMGFSRVVLSRELSLKEIENICKNSKSEIEVFAHGALCMSYSGQCLMSSIIGGRSGNRGMCAQPCRLFYTAESRDTKKDGYLLSLKDLALINEISELEAAGVTSLKIEGRLKRKEYVAAVTRIYSKYKNFTGRVSNEDYNVLEKAFNRSGFTAGYLKEKTGINMFSLKNPGNAAENIFDKETLKYCHPNVNERKITVDIYATLKEGKPFSIDMVDDKLNTVSVKGTVNAQKAHIKPMSKERVVEQILKLGNTPFKAGNVEIVMDDEVIVPISEINSLRRTAVEKLEEERKKIPKRIVAKTSIESGKYCKYETPVLSAGIDTEEQAEIVLKYDIPVIYAPSEIAKKIKNEYPEKTVVTVLPPIWRERDHRKYYIADGVLVSNLGQLEYFKEYNIYGGMRLNIYNSESIKKFKNFKTLALSHELNIHEIKKLFPYVPLEIQIYGRLPLMVTENCPVKMYAGCGKNMKLVDRRKEKFYFKCAIGCYSELLNSKPLYMADKLNDLKNLPVSIYKMDFTTENKEECEKIIKYCIEAKNGEIHKFADNTFTRGHYYRGVE